MKKIFSFLVACALSTGFILVHIATAASNVVQLEITSPTSTKAGEAIDITVRAVDKDKNTVTGYRGAIIFNTDNIGDTVPMPGKSYTFTADDAGKKTFSKWLIFKKSGKQKVYVTDVSEAISGEAIITVHPADTGPNQDASKITIITPEDGTKITSDTVMISWKARKNSKMNIKLNGKNVGTVVTDDSGIFTKTLGEITQENNILIAELIGADNTVLATSPEVKFAKRMTANTTYGVSISPASTVEASSPISITVDATAGLAELTVGIDGSVLVAKESTSGKYVLETVAPSKEWNYTITIAQKDALGQSKSHEADTKLVVTPKMEAPKPVPAFKNIKTVSRDDRVIFDFSVENASTDLHSFKIAYGTDANSLSNEVNTFSLDRIGSQEVSGGYTWYIAWLDEGTYTFKIYGRTREGALISDLVSEPIVVTVGKTSCTIGNVGDLSIQTNKTQSIVSWAALTGAVSYNVYKVSDSDDYTLVKNVKEPKYTIHLAPWAVTYDKFAIKALCDDSTESTNYSEITKVQSGPWFLAFVVIASALIGVFVIRRKSF